jgi:hypothetical protein
MEARIGCCPIGSATGSLPVSSGRWPGWRAPLSLAGSCYALPPASSTEPAILAGTRTRAGLPRAEADQGSANCLVQAPA